MTSNCSIDLADDETSSVHSDINLIEGFGNVGEITISAEGFCYLKSKNNNFKKHWLKIVGNELYFYKHKYDE